VIKKHKSKTTSHKPERRFALPKSKYGETVDTSIIFSFETTWAPDYSLLYHST
jgi:hypothetical protein